MLLVPILVTRHLPPHFDGILHPSIAPRQDRMRLKPSLTACLIPKPCLTSLFVSILLYLTSQPTLGFFNPWRPTRAHSIGLQKWCASAHHCLNRTPPCLIETQEQDKTRDKKGTHTPRKQNNGRPPLRHRPRRPAPHHIPLPVPLAHVPPLRPPHLKTLHPHHRPPPPKRVPAGPDRRGNLPRHRPGRRRQRRGRQVPLPRRHRPG